MPHKVSFPKSLLFLLAVYLGVGSMASADTPQLSVNPDALFFRQTGNSHAPDNQSVALAAKGGTLGAFTVAVSTVSGGSWLSVTPTSGSGPSTLKVSVSVNGLPAGEYAGTITVSAAGFTAVAVKVQLEILGNGNANGGGPPVLSARPNSLQFHAIATGSAPKTQELDVTGTTTAWTAAATVTTPSGGKWLKLSPASGTGKGSIDVSVDPAGLAAGNYSGQITVTSGSNTATVAVGLTVDAAQPANLVIDPRAFNFIVDPNATPAPMTKTLSVKNTGGGTLSWTAAATVSSPAGGKWLTITPTSGSGDGTITLKADPTGLSAGMYAGLVTVKAGSQSAQAQVFLRILGPSRPMVVVAPKALNFTSIGGATSPATRTINVNSKASGLTYTATATTAKGGSWLTITAGASGAVPGTITVSANAGTLQPGTYTGSVQVKIAGAAQEVFAVAVTLRVFAGTESPRLEVEPGALVFTAVKGGSNPATKTLTLEPEGLASIAWTAAASTISGGSWLTISPSSGTSTSTANSTITVTATLGALGTGTYSGAITITPAGSTGAPPVTVNVMLIVTATSVGAQSVASADDGPNALSAGPLTAIFTQPGDHFISGSDVPLTVAVTVVDSAGSAVEGATVTVSSSNAEPDLVLTDIGGGQYSGVFRALSSGTVTLSGAAQINSQNSPAFTVSGDLESAAGQPTIVFQNGAVSAASFAPSPTPVAPGSLLSVFGLGIAGSGGSARAGSALPTSLSGVSVTIGGVSAALVSAPQGSSDPLNIQTPF